MATLTRTRVNLDHEPKIVIDLTENELRYLAEVFYHMSSDERSYVIRIIGELIRGK